VELVKSHKKEEETDISRQTLTYILMRISGYVSAIMWSRPSV